MACRDVALIIYTHARQATSSPTPLCLSVCLSVLNVQQMPSRVRPGNLEQLAMPRGPVRCPARVSRYVHCMRVIAALPHCTHMYTCNRMKILNTAISHRRTTAGYVNLSKLLINPQSALPGFYGANEPRKVAQSRLISIPHL